ncbi:hypothetical protein LJB88_01870 [Erysipelotrichaceae bacterium OttesenSCG-928-M19]|nr:hypothetical protein [Erysipelotrichaceae bacterium OttesenSCG-928-M19]
MKKILSLILVLLLVVACASNDSNTETDAASANNLGYETLTNQDHIIKEVSFDDLKKMNEAKESYYLMIGRPSCGPCVGSILDYSTVAKNNGIKEVYYFSFEEMAMQMNSNNGYVDDNNKEAHDYLLSYYNFQDSTPTFYYVKEGKVALNSNDMNLDNYNSWQEILNDFYQETAE